MKPSAGPQRTLTHISCTAATKPLTSAQAERSRLSSRARGGRAGRAGRGRSVGPGAACSVLMCPASLDDYKGSDVTHILTGTSEIGHIHWDESIHSLE